MATTNDPIVISAGRVSIKICGLTRPGQAMDCARAGADAIGLVFYPESPRHISDDQARSICRVVPPEVAKVGVFVDACLETILAKVTYSGLTAVQLHGNETPSTVEALVSRGLFVIKAVFASRAPLMANATDFRPSAFLVECGRGTLPGGNAAQWDWAGAAGMARPFLLAGGLNPGNVAAAIAAARPNGVDVSSGVEITPGDKDLHAVAAFIQNVRRAQVQSAAGAAPYFFKMTSDDRRPQP